MVFPLGLLYTFERRGRARILYALASLAIGLGLVFSFTRAAWLSLVVVLPVTAGLFAWRRRRLETFAGLARVAASRLLCPSGSWPRGGSRVRACSSFLGPSVASSWPLVSGADWDVTGPRQCQPLPQAPQRPQSNFGRARRFPPRGRGILIPPMDPR